ncbi:carbohydrate sulfotransferase 11-like [Eriocheir sinensis]|uniref:carbohydrate sulfotransferase 11-like n=1 Tax=Eriocheir sinensis TaxID=95602 RepID=UPI0021C6C99A|nr:carbohydrate sulfotransferase 11-like [Eriocheir sinensis]
MKEEEGRNELTEEEKRKMEEEKKKKKEEEEKKIMEKKEKKEETKNGGEGGKKIIRRDFWVDEMEVYSPSNINMEEMEEEMRRRKRRMEERCREIMKEEERKREINSKEFLISKKYKLVWCNIFKSASSTWMYNYLRMGGKSPHELQNLKTSPVEAARQLYSRPSPEELLSYLGSGGEGVGEAGEGVGTGEGYLSFIIVREPFQRLLSAYRDKIERVIPYYSSLRCKMTHEHRGGKGNTLFQHLLHSPSSPTCHPTFPQFVDYILEEEEKGGEQNEHWAPYYKFCSPCAAHFDLVLRFESLQRDEAYLLKKVQGLSEVVSPKVMHSSHANYTSIVASYYGQLSPGQLLGLVKMYLPDFWLFGYSERPYLDLVV